MPLFDTAVLAQQQYNQSAEQQDASQTLKPQYPLVVDSQAVWRLMMAAADRKRGGFESSFNPNPQNLGGGRAYSFYDIFYNRIHYDPAVMRLGQLLNAQTRTLSVWNAYFEQRTLTAVNETDGEGVSIDVDELPQTFLPLEEKIFKISVSVDGPPVIDTTYTFVWDNNTYNYHVTGERIVVLAFPPTPTTDFIERLTWYGTIATAYSGKEQRMALSETPKISYTYRAQVLDEELQRFDAVMWGWQNRVFAVPVWNSYTNTSQGVGVGTTTLFLQDTVGREFEVDRLALIYAGPELFEAVEVQEVLSDRLILKKPLANSWTARVPVMPMRTMRMAKEITYTAPVMNFREVDISLVSEQGEAVPFVVWPVTYKGLPVLEFSPDMAGGISGSYNRNMDWEDGEYSQPLVTDKSGLGTPKQTWQFTWPSYIEAQAFKSLLAQLYGTTGSFWSSTWAPDITLIAEIVANATSFYASAALHINMYFDRKGRSDIVIALRNGQVYYRSILSVTSGGGVVPNSALFVLDNPLPVRILPEDVKCISYLTQSRFENESFEFKWVTQEWVSMSAMIKGLTDGI